MKLSATEDRLASDLETALSGLVKLTRALKIYPTGHPALTTAAQETGNAFQPLLARHATRPYHVNKNGFRLAAMPLSPSNHELKDLAKQLVERQVRQLLFLPELDHHELLIFAEEISRPAAQLLEQGGLSEQLGRKRIRSIWINETDLEKIFSNLRRSEAEPVPLVEKSTAVVPMRDLLELLKEALDDRQYLQTLKKTTQLAPAFFKETGIIGQLALFLLLESQRRARNRSTLQNNAAATTTDSLLNDETIRQLVDAVADPNLKASQRRALARLLIGLGMKVAPVLLNRLYAERDALIRRHYSRILANMGEPLFTLLERSLTDPQWYVVRNVVSVLGETRLDSALPLLGKVLDHPEVRVRRSVIRALSAIGGSQVIPLLVRLSHDDNQDLHQPAIMALGALGDPDVIPPLNTILKKFDPWGKQVELKLEVIKAMAASRSPHAMIPLLKLARRRNLLQRNGLEQLRAEAVLNLGQLGNKHLLPALEQLPKSNKGPLNRALQQAKSQLLKAEQCRWEI